MPKSSASKYLYGLIIAVFVIAAVFYAVTVMNPKSGETEEPLADIKSSAAVPSLINPAPVEPIVANPIIPASSVHPLSDSDKQKSETPPVQKNEDPEKATINLLSYELKADNGVFSPAELVIKKGTRAQINFTALDADYDLLLPAPMNAYITVKAGDKTSFSFVPDKEGRYEFSCYQVCPQGIRPTGVLIIK